MLVHGSLEGHIAPAAGSRVGAIASRALSVMVSRRSCARGLSERHVLALRDVVLDGDHDARMELVGELAGSGIDTAAICDHYIPEVARRLGAEWCEDTTNFTRVTIGSARLQSLLRDVEPGPPLSMPQEGRRLAVIVPDGEHHTLGAMVLTGQIRRRGLSVRLILGEGVAGIADILSTDRFDAVLISLAPRDQLDDVRGIIAALHRGGIAPVIVGGGILDRGCEPVLHETGADHATSDLDAVLALCRHRQPENVFG